MVQYAGESRQQMFSGYSGSSFCSRE